MSSKPTPRRSSLAGLSPAIPAREETVPNRPPAQPGRPRFTDSESTSPSPAERVSTVPESADHPRTKKVTLNISPSLLEEAKDAFWVDLGEYRSFSEWVAHALREHIESTKRRHRLTVLPKRPHKDLPTGRPIN